VTSRLKPRDDPAGIWRQDAEARLNSARSRAAVQGTDVPAIDPTSATVTRRTAMRPSTIATAMLVTAVSATAAAAQMMHTSLYERLGGTPAITAVVDDFVGNVAADRRINTFFAHTDIPRLKFLLVQQICQGTGGPCFYSGRDMKGTHAGLGIRGRHFTALVQDLGKSLNKFKVPAREQKELVAILAPMKRDIVTR
jgi:hemoglobin